MSRYFSGKEINFSIFNILEMEEGFDNLWLSDNSVERIFLSQGSNEERQ
jgi:hypothetical protein